MTRSVHAVSPAQHPLPLFALPAPDRSQRWVDGRDLYVPNATRIVPSEYEVAPIGDGLAKDFVLRQHYSASYPAARFRFGLYRLGRLVGVAVFSHPVRDEVLTNVFPGRATDSVELGRFVLLDEVPANGETWTLARCFELLRREGLAGVVSFSDPCQRTNRRGQVVFGGHWGCAYQAGNAAYLGRSTARTLRLLPDGSVLNERALSKIRARDRGWEYAAELLIRHGAAPLGERDDSRAWLATWLPRLTSAVRHRGCHRYAFSLTRGARKDLERRFPEDKRLPRPKQVDAPAGLVALAPTPPRNDPRTDREAGPA